MAYAACGAITFYQFPAAVRCLRVEYRIYLVALVNSLIVFFLFRAINAIALLAYFGRYSSPSFAAWFTVAKQCKIGPCCAYGQIGSGTGVSISVGNTFDPMGTQLDPPNGGVENQGWHI